MSDKIQELLASGLHSRRRFLAGLGLSAGAAAMIGCGNDGGPVQTTAPPPTTTAAPAGPTDVDILNFALNLEYLEAEFYLRATTGQGLSAADIGTSPGSVTGGSQVPFTPGGFIQAYANEITANEKAHVEFLRKTIVSLGGAPVDRPAIDLQNSFNAAAVAAGIGSAFNPFDNENDFLLGAFIFEDVGVTAYNGAVKAIKANDGTNTTVLQAAAAIHATEAYHAGEIRTTLVYLDAATPSLGLLATASKISALRGAASTAGSASGGSGAAEVAPTSKTIVACDSNSLAFPRTANQVLDIVYLNATGMPAKSGGFYPNGMNGNISASTMAATRR